MKNKFSRKAFPVLLFCEGKYLRAAGHLIAPQPEIGVAAQVLPDFIDRCSFAHIQSTLVVVKLQICCKIPVHVFEVAAIERLPEKAVVMPDDIGEVLPCGLGSYSALQ